MSAFRGAGSFAKRMTLPYLVAPLARDAPARTHSHYMTTALQAGTQAVPAVPGQIDWQMPP